MVVHGDFPLDPRVAREARAARDGGYEVDVVAMRRNGEPAREKVEGMRVYRLPFSHDRDAGFAGFLAEYAGFTAAATVAVARLAWKRRYDVVHVHNPPDFLVAAGLLPKLLGARLVFDVHDLSPDMFDMRFRGSKGAGVAQRVLKIVERAACRASDAVITVHEPYRGELVRRGVPPADVTVVMNSVDETLLPPSAEPPGDSFRIVYHGTVTPHYGVDLVVEAFALVAGRLPHAALAIYGEGDLVPAVRRRAAELGVADSVEVGGGYLPQREVLDRIRGASVGVVPNRPTPLNRFALSSKLFEYVALGIPAVSADLPTLREHFDDQEVRYFRAGSAESLAEALLDVAGDPASAAVRATAAAARYEAYRWGPNAARYVALLDRLSAA